MCDLVPKKTKKMFGGVFKGGGGVQGGGGGHGTKKRGQIKQPVVGTKQTQTKDIWNKIKQKTTLGQNKNWNRTKRRVAPGIAGAETTFSKMVQGNTTVQERSFVTFQTQSGWRAAFRRATTSSSHEQASRASGRRCSWGDREVEGSDRSIGRFDCSRESTQRSPSSCPSTCVGSSSGGAPGIVQALLGTCQEACGGGTGCCRQGSGTENSVRGRGGRGRSEVREALGRGGCCRCSSSCLSTGDRTSGTDQCVGVRTRRSACPSDPWNPLHGWATFPMWSTSHPWPLPTCKISQVG